MTQAPVAQGVSLKPSDNTQGGLVDNANLLIKDASFVWWDYNGAVQPAVPAAKLVFEADDGATYEQYYGCGDAKVFGPSVDGTQLIPMGSATGLNENSNFAIYLKNLVQVGFPESRFDSNIKFLVGFYGFHRRIPAPERAGLTTTRSDDRKPTILVASKALNMPWEPSTRGVPTANGAAPAPVAAAPLAAAVATPAAAVAAAPAAVAAAPAPAAPATDLDATVRAYVAKVITEGPPIISRNDLSSAAFQAFSTDPNRTAIVAAVYSEEVLTRLGNEPGAVFSYADGNISRR